MKELASCLKALADENRLRILNLLMHGELCGCDIQYVLGASQSMVSRHLSYMENADLVVDRRAGYRVYRLVQAEDPEIKELLQYLVLAFAENKTLKTDMKRLREAIKDGSCAVSELGKCSRACRCQATSVCFQRSARVESGRRWLRTRGAYLSQMDTQ